MPAGLAAEEIGVVTPYRRQARLIKKYLRASSRLPEGTAEKMSIRSSGFKGRSAR